VAVENARLYQAVQDLSFTDDLTALPNRRAVVRRLEEELAGAQRGHLSILMVDLDRFKRVNDTHGHPVGDRVLCEAGDLLRRSVRSCDTVGRWGGEEFVILLPNTDLRGAAAVAESLRAAAAGHLFLDGRVPLPQTISVGGLSLQVPARAPLHRLLESVDACLYRAKSAGRNRAIVEEWTPEAGV
jgi:diguanylate cyclase (GGDEF)-like protein